MDKKQFDVLDVLDVISFYVGLLNLDENLSQGKAGELLENAVQDIHAHLREQDAKINAIMEVLDIEAHKKDGKPN